MRRAVFACGMFFLCGATLGIAMSLALYWKWHEVNSMIGDTGLGVPFGFDQPVVTAAVQSILCGLLVLLGWVVTSIGICSSKWWSVSLCEASGILVTGFVFYAQWGILDELVTFRSVILFPPMPGASLFYRAPLEGMMAVVICAFVIGHLERKLKVSKTCRRKSNLANHISIQD
jgi:hypothetical protein